jgi:hypothetical protein
VKLKIDDDLKLRDPALEGCNVADGSANGADDAPKLVRNANAYLREVERRLM